MHKLQNISKAHAQSVLAGAAMARIGIVTSYDPKAYAVKVKIMPEEIETGWLKIMALQVGPGAGFGIYAAPDINVQAVVIHQEGDHNSGFVTGFLNDDSEDTSPPDPGVPAGEIHVLHKSGSFLKFTKDGKVALHTQSDLNATVGGDVNLTVTGKVVASATEFDLTGDVKVTGKIDATGEITAAGSHTVSAHKHGGVQTGGGQTATPTG